MNDQLTFTCERPKFGHNPADANETRSRHNFVGNRSKREHKSASILQAFLHRLSENTKQQLHLVNKKIKTFFFFIRSRRCVNRAGRKPERAGRSALRYMPSWNTVYLMASTTCQSCSKRRALRLLSCQRSGFVLGFDSHLTPTRFFPCQPQGSTQMVPSELQELPFTPAQAPILAITPGCHRHVSH